MLWHPPTSTLFPYTTLFRSGGAHDCANQQSMENDGAKKVFFQREIIRKDRKSTRLNSSHRTMSYAVFGLKKKITAEHRVPLNRGHVPQGIEIDANDSEHGVQ